MADYYDILGVPRDASKDDIKRAYKKLARQYHPDVAQDKTEAERRFGQINEAYSVLADDEKRAYYDRYGSVPSAAQEGADFGGFGGFPFGDLFDTLFDFGGGGRRQRQARPSRGSDLRMGIRISLVDAFQGASREVELTSDVACAQCEGRRTLEADGFQNCPQCAGMGQVQQIINTPFGRLTQVAPCAACRGQGRQLVKPCPGCRGAGRTPQKRTLSVKIPPGMDSGDKIRMRGEGEPGTLGGPPGDLYLVVEVAEHEEFRRQGDDLSRSLKITFTDAALGASVEVPLLTGEKETLKIPGGTQNGTVFRFKGKGMPRFQRSGRGDLHVEVEVMVPTKLNSKQKKLLKEFAEAGSQEAEPQSFFEKIRDAIFG
ncbi:molecular chaperone DnaJ [bacterium CPR1]|nr:molecular chaperone DnaJ [bacterium CPR1]